MPEAIYTLKSTQEVGVMLDSVSAQIDTGLKGQDILDSAKNESGFALPRRVQSLIKDLPEDQQVRMLDSVIIGIREYETAHGVKPTADVVDAAIQQGEAALRHVLDSASSAHSDAMSLQPNRAVVSVVSAMSEAIPFAGYLPIDIGSNQANLAILTHQANSTFGDYASGAIMDGTNSGNVYANSQRMVLIDTGNGSAAVNSKFTSTNLTDGSGYCDPNGTGVKVLRGRTIVYVAGIPVCSDPASGSAANNVFTGSITLPTTGVTHTITGYIAPATGVVQITSVAPALPAGFAKVVVQAFVDYEDQPSLIPLIGVNAQVWPLYANASRIASKLSIDTAFQLRNELGLDGESEALMAIRAQMANERHYLALRYAAGLAGNITDSFDYNYSNQSLQKTRPQIWIDAQAPLGQLDQTMANRTMDHGITHLYASSWIINQWLACGREIFEPSGITNRPGIFRAGRLYGKYEVYYSPKVLSESADGKTSTILAIGRSSQVGRCPILVGDAVAPTFVDIATQLDMNKPVAMYSRDFTAVNPHIPSAQGCASLTITNLK